MHVFRTSHLAVQRLLILLFTAASLCGIPLVASTAAQGEAEFVDDIQPAEEKESLPTDSESDEPKKSEPSLLLKGEQLKQYLEWRNSQRSPDYSVSSVKLKGGAQENGHVQLTATIAIQINRDGQAFRIPLNLNEATLTRHEYVGEGTATPDDEFDRETGYRWWLQGKGEHVLTLWMIVPVKKQLPKRRMQLTVPETAVSGLELHVPLDRLKTEVVTPKDAWVKTTSIARVGTSLEVQWFGRRIDVTWEPLALQGPVETVLNSETVVDVKLTGESVVLKAAQQIQALQGLFSKVTVRLPEGFELLDVEGKAYSSHEVDAGTHVTVALTEVTKGPVELKWTLRSKFPGNGGKLTLEGFEVDRARAQTGELAVSGLEGFRITRRKAEDRFVHRMSVKDLAKGFMASTAYAFHKQPFRLVFDLQEIEPGFTVKPKMHLQMLPDRVQLDASYEFQVYRGAVREVEINWPNAAKEGWNLELVGPPELLNRDLASGLPKQGPLRVPLLRRMTGTFEMKLKATRPIRSGMDFPLSLPSVKASSLAPTLLDLFAAENVEVDLTRGSTNSGALPALNRTRSELIPEELRPLLRATYRIDNLGEALTSKVIVHDRKIATRTAARIELNGRQLQVTQRIHYDVQFERLPQALLLVPKQLGKRVRITLGDSVELTPSSTPLDEGAYHEVRLILPEPQIDGFDIVARYSIDIESLPMRGAAESVVMPLVQSSDSGFSSTRLEWSHNRGFDIAPVEDEMWKPFSNLQDSSVWVAEGAPRNVALQLSDSIRKRTREFYVRRAMLHTVVDSNGVARTRVQYRIDGIAPAVSLMLPPEKIVLDNAWWGDRRLPSADIVEVDSNLGSYRFEDTETSDIADRLLTLEYHSTAASPLSWSRSLTLVSPEFMSGVWVEESVWQLSLPGKQLLFMQPSDYTPRYHWVRRGIFWSRQPLPSHAKLADWIGAANGPAANLKDESGNSYRFSRFGPATDLECRTMLFKFMMFLGAGLSFAAGFVLLNVPLTRNILTFLFLAFAVSATALWFPAPVELLLQPALLGLLSAVLAAAISSVLRQEKRIPILTLSSPNDFSQRSGSFSSVESIPVAGPGSEEPTALRPVVPASEPKLAAQESGSHL